MVSAELGFSIYFCRVLREDLVVSLMGSFVTIATVISVYFFTSSTLTRKHENTGNGNNTSTGSTRMIGVGRVAGPSGDYLIPSPSFRNGIGKPGHGTKGGGE